MKVSAVEISHDTLVNSPLSLLGSIPVRQAGFGNGTGSIILDNLNCVGTEETLLECGSDSSILDHDCQHSEDAGVKCSCRLLLVLH